MATGVHRSITVDKGVKVGLLHPGEMGASVGDALVEAGNEVFWVSEFRSKKTRERASQFTDSTTMAELVGEVESIVSVCPPSEALQLARKVYGLGFRGLYLDANAIAPQTALRISDLFADAYVDGGLIGPPARQRGTTRLYLSGSQAEEVSSWFGGCVLEAKILAGTGVEASSLKMAYAGYTKGMSALLLLINALAQKLGVREGLEEEWSISQRGLVERSKHAARGTAPKAWRFVGEMEEIQKTLKSVGLPSEFHEGAAQIYKLMADLKDVPEVELEKVLEVLLENRLSV